MKTADVIVRARITARQFRYWAALDLFRSVRPAGSGVSYDVSVADGRVAYALGRVAANGIRPNGPLARAVARHIRKHGLHGQVCGKTGFIVIDLDQLDDPFDEDDDR